MKRFIAILCIILFLSLSVNKITIFAQPESKTLTQGIYNARDTNLLIGTPINVRLTDPNDRALIIIVDSNLNIRELIKLGSQSSEHVLKPLDYDSSIIIFGNGSVTLS